MTKVIFFFFFSVNGTKFSCDERTSLRIVTREDKKQYKRQIKVSISSFDQHTVKQLA